MKKLHNTKIIEALDALALALSGHNHIWTKKERSLYEEAVRKLKL